MDVLEALWEHGAWGMAIVDEDGRFEAVNPVLCRMLEYSEPELLGMTFQEITPDRHDLEADEKMVQEIREGKREEFDMVKSYRCKTGRFLLARLRVVGIWTNEGEFKFFLSQMSAATRFGGSGADDVVNVIQRPVSSDSQPRKVTTGDWLSSNKWAWPILAGAAASLAYTLLEMYVAFRGIEG